MTTLATSPDVCSAATLAAWEAHRSYVLARNAFRKGDRRCYRQMVTFKAWCTRHERVAISHGAHPTDLPTGQR